MHGSDDEGMIWATVVVDGAQGKRSKATSLPTTAGAQWRAQPHCALRTSTPPLRHTCATTDHPCFRLWNSSRPAPGFEPWETATRFDTAPRSLRITSPAAWSTQPPTTTRAAALPCTTQVFGLRNRHEAALRASGPSPPARHPEQHHASPDATSTTLASPSAQAQPQLTQLRFLRVNFGHFTTHGQHTGSRVAHGRAPRLCSHDPAQLAILKF